MKIEEVSSLDTKLGKVANCATISLDIRDNNSQLFESLGNLKSAERPGDLFIDLYDTQTRQKVKVHSRRRYPINKELVDILNGYQCNFKVTTENF